MLQKVITLMFALLFTLQYTYAKDPDFDYSVPVQNSLNILKKIFTTIDVSQQPEINPDANEIDQTLLALLKQNHEQKIQSYIDDRKKLMIKQLKNHIKNGDATATVALVEYALTFKDYEGVEPIDLQPLEILSEQNNAYASYVLAQVYEGTEEYIPLLEKAGEQGSTQAQRTLVDEYNFRLPVELQNAKKAEYWKQKAIASMGADEYEEEVCKMANCDTGEFELVDFSKIVENHPKDSPAKQADETIKQAEKNNANSKSYLK